MVENAIMLASVLGPVYLVAGISLLLYPKSWKLLLERYTKDHFQLFAEMFFALIAGLVMIRLYNSWQWDVWFLVTLTAWVSFLKGVFYFLAPREWILPVLKFGQRQDVLYAAAFVALLFGAALSYGVYAL